MRKVTDTTKPPYPTEQVHASSDNSSLPSERSAWKSHLELEGMGCAEVHVLYSFDQGAFISWVAKHAIKAYVSKSGPWLVLNSGKYEFAYNLLMSCWTRSQGRHPDNYATNQIITVVCYSQKYFHWVKKRIEKFFIYLFLHFHFFLCHANRQWPNRGRMAGHTDATFIRIVSQLQSARNSELWSWWHPFPLLSLQKAHLWTHEAWTTAFSGV